MKGRGLVAGFLLMAAASMAPAAAVAASLDDLETLYASGAFLEAARLGREIGSAQALVVAARAEGCYAAYLASPEERLAGFHRVADLARDALTLEPTLAEAHLQYAIALGQIAHGRSALGAELEGYARDARTHLDAVLEADPENPWAWAISGAWHAALVERAGPLMASSLYGASRETSLQQFEHALALDSDNVLIRFEFGRVLLKLDPVTYRDRAQGELQRAAAMSVQDACSALARDRARRLAVAVAQNDRVTIDVMIAN